MTSLRDRPRIALYSHDTMGLGHIRRNLLLARRLSQSPLAPDVLLLSGMGETKGFQTPPGVDSITLPSLHKRTDGRYAPRRLRMGIEEIIDLRRRTLEASVEAFDPDLFIADTAPWGVHGELDATLEMLAAGGRAQVVLGVRDVWDEPSVIAREWAAKDNWGALRRYYSQAWVYGDPSVYDPVQEYGVEADIAPKFRYTGYLGRTPDVVAEGGGSAEGPQVVGGGPFVLCLVGGGQDGGPLAEAFLDAGLPRGRTGVVVAGPFMDPGELDRLRALALKTGRAKVVEFISEPIPLIQGAESVVSMGGYNSICEIMTFRKRALIVPRVTPRREQAIRAQRLHDLGLVEVLHPSELGPEAIGDFLQREAIGPLPSPCIRMDGLATVSETVESLLSAKGFGGRERLSVEAGAEVG